MSGSIEINDAGKVLSRRKMSEIDMGLLTLTAVRYFLSITSFAQDVRIKLFVLREKKKPYDLSGLSFFLSQIFLQNKVSLSYPEVFLRDLDGFGWTLENFGSIPLVFLVVLGVSKALQEISEDFRCITECCRRFHGYSKEFQGMPCAFQRYSRG